MIKLYRRNQICFFFFLRNVGYAGYSRYLSGVLGIGYYGELSFVLSFGLFVPLGGMYDFRSRMWAVRSWPCPCTSTITGDVNLMTVYGPAYLGANFAAKFSTALDNGCCFINT